MTDAKNQQQIDPYLCTCGPCKRFWRETFMSNSELLSRSLENRALDSATLGQLKPEHLLTIGDRVSVNGQTGQVKFFGFVDDSVVAPQLRVGIKLDEQVHLGHDGMFNGKRYFHCTPGHGIMVRYKDVIPLKPCSRRPPVKGNSMFPSWPEICKRRKQREAMLQEMYKKKSQTTPCHHSKPPRSPTIPPRDNRAMQLRREVTIASQPQGAFLVIKDDPHDIAYRDTQKRKKREVQEATLSSPQTKEVQWERGLMQQWRRKYDDPDKAGRMGETLLKLCSAYKEGQKIRNVTAE